MYRFILPCKNAMLFNRCCVEWPFGYLVRWLPYILIIGTATESTFLSRLACHILNLANMHGIHLLPVYLPTHSKVEAGYLSQGRLVPEWHLLPHLTEKAFHLWSQLKVDLLATSHTNQCQHYYTLENPIPLGALGLNAWTFS